MAAKKDCLIGKFIQKPNALIITAVSASVLLRIFTDGMPHTVFRAVATVAWSAFGYDELRHGTNRYRRILGGAVLVAQLFYLIY